VLHGFNGEIGFFTTLIIFLASICYFISVVCMNFTKTTKLTELTALFDIIDSDLYQVFKYRVNPTSHERIVFVTFQVLFLSHILMEAIIYLTVLDFRFFLKNMPPFLITYMIVVIITQYNSLVMSVGLRCQFLNEKLTELSSFLIVYKRMKQVSVRGVIGFNINPKFFAINYGRICDLIALLNQIFGVQVLLIFLIIFMYLIKVVILLVTSILHLEKDDRRVQSELLMLFSNLLGNFVFLVSSIRFYYSFAIVNCVLVLWFSDVTVLYQCCKKDGTSHSYYFRIIVALSIRR
jgi:hypothetical protein